MPFPKYAHNIADLPAKMLHMAFMSEKVFFRSQNGHKTAAALCIWSVDSPARFLCVKQANTRVLGNAWMPGLYFKVPGIQAICGGRRVSISSPGIRSVGETSGCSAGFARVSRGSCEGFARVLRDLLGKRSKDFAQRPGLYLPCFRLHQTTRDLKKTNYPRII